MTAHTRTLIARIAALLALATLGLAACDRTGTGLDPNTKVTSGVIVMPANAVAAMIEFHAGAPFDSIGMGYGELTLVQDAAVADTFKRVIVLAPVTTNGRIPVVVYAHGSATPTSVAIIREASDTAGRLIAHPDSVFRVN